MMLQSFSQNITNFFTVINGQKNNVVHYKTGLPIANSDAIQSFIRYANVDYARMKPSEKPQLQQQQRLQ
jgi:hypothetical protein